jgi:opacity protein-like surface antigen
MLRVFLAALACALPALAQADFSQWELGANLGYGIYRNGTIYAPGGNATAGIRNRFTAGATVCEDLYTYFSGEARYEYHDGHPFLSSGGMAKDIQGQSHTFTYEVLFHLKPRGARIRPYIAAGPGAKGYIIAGPPPKPQPFPAIATLNPIDEWKFVTSIGAGVKYRIREHVLLRADFRDYLTQFPKRQLAPAANGTARGIFQQFTPMFGVSYVF